MQDVILRIVLVLSKKEALEIVSATELPYKHGGPALANIIAFILLHIPLHIS